MSVGSRIDDLYRDELTQSGFTRLTDLGPDHPIMYATPQVPHRITDYEREASLLVTDAGFTLFAQLAPVAALPEEALSAVRDDGDGYSLTQLPGVPPDGPIWTLGMAVPLAEDTNWEATAADPVVRARHVELLAESASELRDYASTLMQRIVSHVDETAFGELKEMMKRLEDEKFITNGMVDPVAFIQVARVAFLADPSPEAFATVYGFVDGRALLESARVGGGPWEKIRQGLEQIRIDHGWPSTAQPLDPGPPPPPQSTATAPPPPAPAPSRAQTYVAPASPVSNPGALTGYVALALGLLFAWIPIAGPGACIIVAVLSIRNSRRAGFGAHWGAIVACVIGGLWLLLGLISMIARGS